MPETITLLLDVKSQHKHEHGIDTFVIHMTPELAASLVSLSKVASELALQPSVSSHLEGRQVAALVLREPATAPGLFTPPNPNTREARRTRARYAGVWASSHNASIARASGVSERHIFVTPRHVWWSARASIKQDEITTATVNMETLEEIAAGRLKP